MWHRLWNKENGGSTYSLKFLRCFFPNLAHSIHKDIINWFPLRVPTTRKQCSEWCVQFEITCSDLRVSFSITLCPFRCLQENTTGTRMETKWLTLNNGAPCTLKFSKAPTQTVGYLHLIMKNALHIRTKAPHIINDDKTGSVHFADPWSNMDYPDGPGPWTTWVDYPWTTLNGPPWCLWQK